MNNQSHVLEKLVTMDEEYHLKHWETTLSSTFTMCDAGDDTGALRQDSCKVTQQVSAKDKTNQNSKIYEIPKPSLLDRWDPEAWGMCGIWMEEEAQRWMGGDPTQSQADVNFLIYSDMHLSHFGYQHSCLPLSIIPIPHLLNFSCTSLPPFFCPH